ncbi:hypothetical protein [Pseudomonas serboccidentalis]|uniref:hypothetical protein n=1 Tax=Pseudomonas serboccidentalis TaxID=2964670 RepID=UPI0039E02C4E
MPIRRKDLVPLSEELIANIADSVDGHIEKITSYLNDDDWSLIIKLHALLESAISQLLVSKIDTSIQAVIERLPLSDNSIGKGRMALEMGLISESQYRFLRKFSELRNNLVHKVDNVGFNLKSYVDALDQNQRKVWKGMLAWSAPGEPKRDFDEDDCNFPRTGLYVSVLRLVMAFAVEEKLSLMTKKVLELSDEIERELWREGGI